MKQDGTNFTCDRCGYVEFVAENSVWPEGDEQVPFCWSVHDDKHLCPTCTEAYNTMMNNFYAPVVNRPLELDI